MTGAQLFAAALVGAACISLCHPASRFAQEPARTGLTAAQFKKKLHQELRPPRDELWRTIPWHVSIVKGRELAARTRKPIFVWVASGEPLGCG